MNHSFWSQTMLKELNNQCVGGGYEDDANDFSDASVLTKQLLVTVCAANNYLYLEIVQKKPEIIIRGSDKLTYMIDFFDGSQ
jgi:hypothetical protein